MKTCAALIFPALILLSRKIDETLGFPVPLPVHFLRSTTRKTASASSTWRHAGRLMSATTLWMNSSSVGDNDPLYIDLVGRNRSEWIKEAEALRARAKEIYAEATAMEAELQKAKSKRLHIKVSESDDLIELLFLSLENSTVISDGSDASNPAATVAERLQKDRWSTDQVLIVVDRMSQRQVEAMGQNVSAPAFKIGNVQNTTLRINETEYERLADAMDTLLGAVAILDRKKEKENKRWSGRVENAVKSRINELKRTQQSNMDRWVAAEINRVANSTESVEAYVRQTFGQPTIVDDTSGDAGAANASDILERIALVPMWVPSSFLPFIISCQKSTLGSEQVESIINNVLMGSRFYMTSHESVSGAALFRGNIRTPLGTVDAEAPKNDTARVFKQIQDRLDKRGLADEVQLFMLPDPEWHPRRDGIEETPKPVILALSKAVSPDESKIEPSRAIEVGKVRRKNCCTLHRVMLCYVMLCYLTRCFVPEIDVSSVTYDDIFVVCSCIFIECKLL
jgi:hypothetical protein